MALIIALGFSTRAIDIWNESQQELMYDKQSDDLEEGAARNTSTTIDRHYNFGHRRINLLAAFFNCVFLIFIFVFDWVENVHVVMEHWEEQEKNLETVVPDSIVSESDEHTSESNYYISMFAVIRIFVTGFYIYFEAKKFPLYTYMQANWMGWPKRNRNKYGISSPKLKQKLLQIQPWNSYMLNVYSIQLMFCIQFIKAFGQIWKHFLCLNFGLVENIFAFNFQTIMILPVLPLFFDVMAIFMHRVNPPHLFDHVRQKVHRMETNHHFTVLKFNLWAVDKSFIICEMKLRTD